MAGIYIHFPFCSKICNYCDFHKSASLRLKDEMIGALGKEIELQRDYLSSELIETIYFGGGTPSLLSADRIVELINKVCSLYKVSDQAEISLEANPDDLTEVYLKQLVKTPVNRLSIGCQSFSDDELAFLGRRHNAKQSFEAVQMAKEEGFDNISIDLIYGIPESSGKVFEYNLGKTFELDIQHISAYHLTIEKGTSFYLKKKKGELSEIPEEKSSGQFEKLIEQTQKNNFIQYEISNFSKPGFISKHNSNYWKQVKYLGIGPSAHSFDISSRQWNVANNKQYIQSINNGEIPFTKEVLDPETRYNEYIISSMRTMWGVDLNFIESGFSKELKNYCLAMATGFIKSGLIIQKQDQLVLSTKGKFVSDYIMAEMLYVTE